MGATTQQRYGAANAYRTTITEYAPDPARPVLSIMAEIASRLLGGRWAGHHYPSGPGTPEESFTGYASAAPTSMTRAVGVGNLGRGANYPDVGLNTMASGISDSEHGDVTRALFAERLRRRGVAM